MTHWLNRSLGWRVERRNQGWMLYNQYGYAGTYDTLLAALDADRQMSANEP